jgi:hypothetical protein
MCVSGVRSISVVLPAARFNLEEFLFFVVRLLDPAWHWARAPNFEYPLSRHLVAIDLPSSGELNHYFLVE